MVWPVRSVDLLHLTELVSVIFLIAISAVLHKTTRKMQPRQVFLENCLNLPAQGPAAYCSNEEEVPVGYLYTLASNMLLK